MYKWLIKLNHIYAEKPKKAQTTLLELINNYHLPFPLPKLSQLQNYLYNQKLKILLETYPDIANFVSDICKVRYTPELPQDDIFFLDDTISQDEVSILFTSKSLLSNLFKQEINQNSFFHIDATYKILDLRFPVVHLSTETINHNYRPLFFYITESETTEKIKKMLTTIIDFLKDEYNYIWKPKFVLSDNADNFISACHLAFKHNYSHLTCLFHLKKGINDKLKKETLKDYEKQIWYGIKCLKNCETLAMRNQVWKLVKKYWDDKEVPEEFIKNFELEYIKKKVYWFNGCSFAGKSRTNNSLESGIFFSHYFNLNFRK